MKKFDYGWWNCFNSYTNEITFNIGGYGVNSTVCLKVLSNAGITIEEAEDAAIIKALELLKKGE